MGKKSQVFIGILLEVLVPLAGWTAWELWQLTLAGIDALSTGIISLQSYGGYGM